MEKKYDYETLKEQLQEQEIKLWQAQRSGCDEVQLALIREEIKTLKAKIKDLR